MGRSYDAQHSRACLLEAAHALFSERGYEATTTRQIAQRANVDAALIARYFGNKEQLYIAAVAIDGSVAAARTVGGDLMMPTDAPDGLPLLTPQALASWLFRRTRDTGPGPSMQALMRSDTAPEIRAAAAARIDQLFTRPLTAAFTNAGVAQPRLRAEFVVFTMLGLIVGRAQPGSDLAAAGHDELVGLVEIAMNAVEGG